MGNKICGSKVSYCVRYGNHETQVLEGGEADIHTIYKDCEKNPGHTKFIAVDTFNKNHLPEGHRNVDLYEYVKLIADLTVRVDVYMTSPHRPEFYPNTNDLFPFYNNRGKTELRTGSGTISEVDKFIDGYRDDLNGGKHEKNYTTCWCKQCQNSVTASHMWWEFYVYTATHVVFDDIEASHTSLRLFYNKEECPVVKVDHVIVCDISIEKDRCRLKCVTCDKSLGDKLEKLWRSYDDIWRKVLNKYKESRNADKLTIIVSHPHGCYKQVTVGQWVKKEKFGELSRFFYTTCTCPGSSGAKVNCLGFEGDGWLYKLVHRGKFNSKLNYSGAGVVW